MARVFGSMACAWIPDAQRKGELDAAGRWFVVLGLCEDSKAWRLWDPIEDRVRETTDVRFWEYVMYKTWKRGKGREEMEREVEVENLFPSPNVVSHENFDVCLLKQIYKGLNCCGNFQIITINTSG